MSAGQIAALLVLVPAALVALVHTVQELYSMSLVLRVMFRRGGDLNQYKITTGLLGVALGGSVLGVAFWLVLG